MQTALTYRTNRDLFSNYYLDEHLPETEAWDELSDDELREAKADIMDLWEREKGTAPKRNESQLEEKFIRPMFRELGIPFEVEESTSRTQRRPDYGFFESEDAARGAFERREEGGDFYKDAVAVADAKRWGRPLDTRGSGEHERDFENPSYQIHVYLQETPARWAVLTDGKKWRLYYGPTSHRLDSYYEIDLPTVLEKGDLEDFKYFYLFFRHGAFLEDSSGECFLDEVYDESNVFAQELGEDLQDNIYEAIKVLSEGFMQYPDNDLSEDDLDLIHDSSLIYLYRLIFVLYAESEGRDLLDTDNEIYKETYSLNSLKQDVAEELDSPDPKYRDWQDNLWNRLDELFKLIDQGSKSRGIPEEDLYIPAYNGGLFRTDPDEDDSVEARFLANHQVGDAYLAEVIELLTRSQNGNGGGKIFVDYSSLDVRHLGSIYEGLLEYQLDVADEPLALEDGEYVPAGEGDEVIVEEGEVHLSTGSGERKATGSYYTPEYVVEYIVEETLGPLVEDIRSDLVGYDSYSEGGFADEFAERVFDLKILDPAMGSGHFLTSAVDYLAREIIDAQERQAAQQGIETVAEEHDINWARRQVAQRCIYGVDLNPLAVELAKVSLWLRTLAAEQPLAFLDHHLKTGNSLVGSDIEEIEELESEGGNDGPNASLADFGVARKGTIEQLMRIYQDFIAIENQDLADVKEMEAKYDEFERNKLRQRLEAMTNVHTAEGFGLDNLPSDAYKRMAAALEDDEEWSDIQEMQWFKNAQKWAHTDEYFHWKLEFPEVYYTTDGQDIDSPGFDAVIGNPPYVRMEEFKQLKNYLEQQYTTHAARTDLYIYFVERSVADLLREGGEYGVIVSNKFLRANYGASVRSLLASETNIREITDFGGLPVFPEATVRSAILLANNSEPDRSPPRYVPVESLDFDSLAAEVERSGFEVDPDGVQGEEWRLVNRKVSGIITKLEGKGEPLKEVLQYGDICRGVVTGRNAAFFINEEKRDELINQDSDSREVIEPMIRGEDIGQYHIQEQGRYMLYIPHGIDIDRYPAVEKHLRQYKEELEGRATEQAWYELQQPQEEYIEYFDGPKILYPEIAPEMRFAFDKGPLYPNNKCFFLPTERLSLMALLNSTLSAFYLRQILAKLEGVSGDDVYYEFRRQYMERLPVCDGIDEVHEETGKSLEKLAEEMMRLHEERQSLNLSLLDYIGIPSDELPEQVEGKTIAELQMPASGIADTPLSKTSEDLDGLRIEDISFDGDSNTLTLLVDVSYKPEDDDERETDQYGRLEEDEFETYEAMVFTGLSEDVMDLIQNFLPVAVEKREGYADFRRNATSTNTLFDRLSDITLPEIDDVRGGLQRYLDVREQADELDQRIQKTSNLIDQIIYDFYELTDEEIEIVESVVQDD